ncbi:class 1 fructose-bisphosphatase [Spirosoma montaniterrae]|uniref:Fructose-1,6-bisphosphatase class 1 n=1 Tax=Spirosoma montaniterrae TaxID=1178516 RepID=A0A1P9WTK7_9BACT|nr:class 1 fructose-bisphosphatase [Spirosoma montaniterrae]AQG78709.1 fructose-bisphosphatase [Spirosoma montaniterrae]
MTVQNTLNGAETAALGLPIGTTLDRFIKRQQSQYPSAVGDFSQLLRDIALASKIVNREINRAGLSGLLGTAGSTNIQGEMQQKLDLSAHIRFLRALNNGGEVAAIVSEEEPEIIHTDHPDGKYVVALDPLDGSSNFDTNVSVGTIFSVYRRITPIGTLPTEADFLQGGRRQVAAGYVLYGPSTMLVFTTGNGVNGFTYDPSLGEFMLSHPQLQCPSDGTVYSCNDGYLAQYDEAVQQYIDQCRERGYSARYIGAFVADFHRNLLKGGIYLYPGTLTQPAGKIRLLYEAFPMAWLAEQANGRAETGAGPVLNVRPDALHGRTPIFAGSAQLVADVVQLFTDSFALSTEQV